jgi:hypothetical protein
MDFLLPLIAQVEEDDSFNFDGGTVLYVLIIILVILAIVYLVQRIR